MPVINRSSVNVDINAGYYEPLVERQTKADKNYDTLKEANSIPVGSAPVVQWEDRLVDPWQCNRQRWPQPQWPILQSMSDKNRMVYHQEQQACEEHIRHNWAVLEELAIQGH